MHCPSDRGGCGGKLEWDDPVFCKDCITKAKERIKRHQRLIESLVDVFGDSEGQTIDEIKAELKEEGIDLDAAMGRLMVAVKKRMKIEKERGNNEYPKK